ncbi:MAG TPA: glycosyltransferase [Candidatus Sulfotelmatobacter sp.]|nr:glycosyltransferase [Candidatus Sulfotelmatobacter sp.]
MTCRKLSVVMSVFNGERFLREAVESVLAQSFGDFEFIIINDGSSDDSAAILELYQSMDSRVIVHHQENRGLIDSLNRGCSLAQGTYIARMDADDISLRGRFASQLEFMDANPQVAVVGGAVEFIDETGKALRVAGRPLLHSEIQKVIFDCGFMWHPTVVMRKEAWARVGGYRQIPHAEDFDLWLRIAEHFQLGNLPQVLLKYRLHAGQVSVAHCKKQALAAAAVRFSATARRNGRDDPLDSIVDITPEALRQIGVNEAEQETSLARAYLSSVRNMYDSGKYELALQILKATESGELRKAQAWTLADLRLCAAKIHWKEKNVGKSLRWATHAVMTRPAILGRPLKPLLTWLGAGLQFADKRACFSL